jgi:hypothetical protein
MKINHGMTKGKGGIYGRLGNELNEEWKWVGLGGTCQDTEGFQLQLNQSNKARRL